MQFFPDNNILNVCWPLVKDGSAIISDVSLERTGEGDNILHFFL